MIDENQLSRELSRRAQDLHADPITLDDIRGRARSIRRRRATSVSAVAAAAVLAIVVPTALFSGGTKDSAPDPAPPAPTAPGASVLHDGVVTLPDGGTVPIDVPNGNVGYGVLTDGRVVVARYEPTSLQIWSPDGELVAEHPIGNSVVTMSADDEAAAWMERDGSIQVLTSGAAGPVELGTVEVDPSTGAMIDAVLDAGHVLVGNGNTTTTEVTAEGVSQLTTSEPLRVTDVSLDGDLWAVQYADDADPQFGCSGLYDPEAEQMATRNCETSYLQFSPDGEHLTGSRGDGGTWGYVEVFDRDLQRVLEYETEAGIVVKEWAWDDADHLLVTVAGREGSRPDWSLLRVPINGGEPEVVEGPVSGPVPEYPSVFLLSE